MEGRCSTRSMGHQSTLYLHSRHKQWIEKWGWTRRPQGLHPQWPTSCSKTSPPKWYTFQRGTTRWGPSLQTYQPMGSISHSNHSQAQWYQEILCQEEKGNSSLKNSLLISQNQILKRKIHDTTHSKNILEKKSLITTSTLLILYCNWH